MLFFAALLVAIVINPAPQASGMPFCTVLNKRVAPIILLEARDNEAIAQLFPALLDYHRSTYAANIERSKVDMYRLRKSSAQLSQDQPALQVLLKQSFSATGTDKEDRELLQQTGIGLSSVMAEQQGIARAVKGFIDQEEFQADMESFHLIQSNSELQNTIAAAAQAKGDTSVDHLALAASTAETAGGVNESPYARSIATQAALILEQESYLHELVVRSIQRCESRRQAAKPTPKP